MLELRAGANVIARCKRKPNRLADYRARLRQKGAALSSLHVFNSP